MSVTVFTIPKGVLKSFANITFNSRRSNLVGDWALDTTPAIGTSMNSPYEVDTAGLAVQSMHAVYNWEYVINPFGSTVKAVQDELSRLTTALYTKNPDGSTGQVGLITVGLLGYTSPAVDATGWGRIIHFGSAQGGQVYEKVHIGFFVPQGFSYQALAVP